MRGTPAVPEERALKTKLSGEPTNSGDRDSHGTGSTDARHPSNGPKAGNVAGLHRHRSRPHCFVAPDATHDEAALQNKCDRSGHILVHRGVTHSSSSISLLYPCAQGD